MSENEWRGGKDFGHSADFTAPPPDIARNESGNDSQYVVVQAILAVTVIVATLAVAMTYGDFDSGIFGFVIGAIIVVAGGIGSFFGGIVGFRLTESMKPTAISAIARGMLVAAVSFGIAAVPFVLIFVVGIFYALLLGVQLFGTQSFIVSILWSLAHWKFVSKAKVEFRSDVSAASQSTIWFWLWLVVSIAMLVVAISASVFYAKFLWP